MYVKVAYDNFHNKRSCDDDDNELWWYINIYTVVHKKVHPFSFYNKCVKYSPNLMIFGRIIALPMLYTVT